MSGFEVTFSPVDGVQGYEDITHMFGSTGLMEYSEPFLLRDFSGYDEIMKFRFFVDLIDEGDNGITGWCASDDSEDFLVDVNCVAAELPVDPINDCGGLCDSTTKDLATRVIGFKTTTGLSRSGLVKNIRSMEILRDTSNCEMATWNSANSFETLSYEYGSKIPATLEIEASLTTVWGEECPFTVTNYLSEDDATISFTGVGLTSFTVSFQDDTSVGISTKQIVLTTDESVTLGSRTWTLDITVESSTTTNTHFTTCKEETNEFNPNFDVCTLAMSLGFTCPPTDGDVVCLLSTDGHGGHYGDINYVSSQTEADFVTNS